MALSKEYQEVTIIIYLKTFQIENCIGTEVYKTKPEELSTININCKNFKSTQFMKMVKEHLIVLLNKFCNKSADYLWSEFQ